MLVEFSRFVVLVYAREPPSLNGGLTGVMPFNGELLFLELDTDRFLSWNLLLENYLFFLSPLPILLYGLDGLKAF